MDKARYQGEFVRFGAIWSWPKQVQRLRPQIIVGGEGSRVLDRVLDYGDESGPNAEDGLEGRVRELQSRAAELGRAPVPVTAFRVRPDLATLRSYAEAGVTRCDFSLPSAGEDAVRAVLDELGRLVEAYHAEQ